MNAPHVREWLLPAFTRRDFLPIGDIETVLRLAPQWDLSALRLEGPPVAGSAFELAVEHDRDERALTFAGRIEAFAPGETLQLELDGPGLRLRLAIRVLTESGGSRLRVEIDSDPPPGPADLREYDLWARSLLDYLRVSRSRAWPTRLWKWFLDRWWLRMTQSGKRMVFFIVAGEALSLVLLVAVLLWWRFVSAP
jgi:hypothetical protein